MLKIEAIDIEKVREDFPILKRKINGRPLIYFDNAATSQKPKQVIEALNRYYRAYNANIHRAVHTLGEEATAEFEEARDKVARFINARSREEIVFVRGTTEALNLVARSWGEENVSEGEVVLLTEMEHHSNIVPWQLLAKRKGARLEFISIDDEGLLKLDGLGRFGGHLKLVSVTHASNVLGTINPLKKLVKYAHENGALAIVDGAQSAPHMPVDVQEIGCDFFAFSAHKMLGPTGIGVLYGRREVLEEMEPFLGGGDMIKEVHLREARWNDLPWKFEAGTSNIADAIGLGVAVDYLSGIGMRNVREHEKGLTKHALEVLSEVKGVSIYGPKDAELRGGVVSFNVGDIHPHDLATLLDREGIAIRSGHHCAQPLMERLGIPAASRASFYIYNMKEEVDSFVEALERAKGVFGL